MQAVQPEAENWMTERKTTTAMNLKGLGSAKKVQKGEEKAKIWQKTAHNKLRVNPIENLIFPGRSWQLQNLNLIHTQSERGNVLCSLKWWRRWFKRAPTAREPSQISQGCWGNVKLFITKRSLRQEANRCHNKGSERTEPVVTISINGAHSYK